MSYLGGPTETPLRLSVGASPVAKVFAVLVGLSGLSIMAVFVGIAWTSGTIAESSAPNFDPTGGPVSSVATGVGTTFKLFGLCALPIAALFLYVVVSVLRRAAWLEGTTVRMRGAFTTKRVDLATANVSGDAVTYRQSNVNSNYATLYVVPALAARDPSTGRQIKIPLRGMGLKRLPSNELTALATAVMSRRHPSDPDYAATSALADSMRQMAANPFPV